MSATTCSPGTLLLQPQRLKRAAAMSKEMELAGDFLSLFSGIAIDKVRGGTMLDVLGLAFEALGTRLLQQAGAGLTRAEGRFRSLVEPLVKTFTNIASTLPNTDDPAVALAALLPLVGQLADILKGMTIEHLRSVIGEFLDVLQNDLGLTSAAGEALVWSLIDDFATRLEAVAPEADPDVKANRLAVIGALRRIHLHGQGLLSIPELRADFLATALYDDLRGTGFADVLAKIACVGDDIGASVTLAKDLLDVVPFTGFGSRSVGAAAAGSPPSSNEHFLWYASWALGGPDNIHKQVWASGVLGSIIQWFISKPEGDLWNDDWWVDSDGHVRQSNEVVFQSSEVDWTRLPGDSPSETKSVTFGSISADAMEGWARHTAYASDFFDMLLQVVKFDDVPDGKPPKITQDVSSWILSVLDAGHATYQIAANKPLGFGLFHNVTQKDGVRRFYASVLPALADLIGSALEGWHSNASVGDALLFWLCMYGADLLNGNGNAPTGGNFWKAAIASAGKQNNLRDFLLSLLTLINYHGPRVSPGTDSLDNIGPNATSPRDDRPDNRTQIDGVVRFFMMLFSFAQVKALNERNRDQYGINGGGGQIAKIIFLYPLIGAAFGLMAGFSGTVVAECIAWAEDWPLLGKTIYKSVVQMGLSFIVAWYNHGENDTNGGKYSPNPGPGGDQNNQFTKGYPPADASPYLLPWQKGKRILCIQGNQGIFSHNAFSNPTQVYAYDFGLDKGTEILAARPGRVVDWFDWVPDGSHPGAGIPAPAGATSGNQTSGDTWNFIMIMHDQEGPPNPVHDVGLGGVATTYAIYGHGQMNSVRQVFAARGVAPGSIIGTVVQQGQPIMLADNTGNSFCNHTHMEVRTGPPPAPPAAGMPWAGVGRGSVNSSPTIPFVFKDEEQPGSMNKVTSDNPRIP